MYPLSDRTSGGEVYLSFKFLLQQRNNTVSRRTGATDPLHLQDNCSTCQSALSGACQFESSASLLAVPLLVLIQAAPQSKPKSRAVDVSDVNGRTNKNNRCIGANVSIDNCVHIICAGLRNTRLREIVTLPLYCDGM